MTDERLKELAHRLQVQQLKGHYSVRDYSTREVIGLREEDYPDILSILDAHAPMREELEKARTISLDESMAVSIKEVCEFCVLFNPAHASCESCEDVERYRLELAKWLKIHHRKLAEFAGRMSAKWTCIQAELTALRREAEEARPLIEAVIKAAPVDLDEDYQRVKGSLRFSASLLGLLRAALAYKSAKGEGVKMTKPECLPADENECPDCAGHGCDVCHMTGRIVEEAPAEKEKGEGDEN